MPFGCVPIRQAFRKLRKAVSAVLVSNAFRLCAYPAECERGPNRLPRADVSNAFRLCAYPAVSLRSNGLTTSSPGLQCLSAVCLSGRDGSIKINTESQYESPMPFGCVPIRQNPMERERYNERLCLQCLSAVCLSGRPHCGRNQPLPNQVSNAFRLCAYPADHVAAMAHHRRLPVSNAFRLCAYPAVHTPAGSSSAPTRRLQCLSAVCLSGRNYSFCVPCGTERCLQCLSAVCLSGRLLRHDGRESRIHGSPMPFGCVPIRQPLGVGLNRNAVTIGLQCLSAVCLSGRPHPGRAVYPGAGRSPMPFGCVPIRQGVRRFHPLGSNAGVSNAFRLCAYPAAPPCPLCLPAPASCLQCLSAVCLSGSRQCPARATRSASSVSNAFRLCAYPAGRSVEALIPGVVIPSPMPFGCVPIRQQGKTIQYLEDGVWNVSNAFRLCAYPADWRTSSRSGRRGGGSPMPFGCVPIRQFLLFWPPAHCLPPVSNAFRLCAYPAGTERKPRPPRAGGRVSNAFRLCAYPAAYGD